jgi:hypothetical protein
LAGDLISAAGPRRRTCHSSLKGKIEEFQITLILLAAPNVEIKDGAVATNNGYVSPTALWYTPKNKAAAEKIVGALRAGCGTETETMHCVASKRGYGFESVRV